MLKTAWPRTYEIEISFADELDELFADELWELGEELGDTQKWWILKPLSDMAPLIENDILFAVQRDGRSREWYKDFQ